MKISDSEVKTGGRKGGLGRVKTEKQKINSSISINKIRPFDEK